MSTLIGSALHRDLSTALPRLLLTTTGSHGGRCILRDDGTTAERPLVELSAGPPPSGTAGAGRVSPAPPTSASRRLSCVRRALMRRSRRRDLPGRRPAHLVTTLILPVHTDSRGDRSP